LAIISPPLEPAFGGSRTFYPACQHNSFHTNFDFRFHAVLHKIEGDRDNSLYWYSRAGKTEQFRDAQEELQEIRRKLSSEAG
jgi:hypothetical protein